MKNNLAIATVSWIRTPEESGVVLQTIRHLNELNLPIVITDVGSPKSDIEKIKQMKNVVLFESKEGLTSQLIKSHEEASKLSEYIFYLHTDKLDFARDTAPKMVEKYLALERKGILIPSRTQESMKTYPEYQKIEEQYLNFIVSDYVGVSADYFAGPKIFPANFVRYIEKMNGQIGWGIEAYFYAIAKRLNLPFDFLSFYMKSPLDIEDQDKTKKYRLKIVQWQIDGLIQGEEVELS